MIRLFLLAALFLIPQQSRAACTAAGGGLNLEIPQIGDSGSTFFSCLRRDLISLSTNALVSTSLSNTWTSSATFTNGNVKIGSVTFAMTGLVPTITLPTVADPGGVNANGMAIALPGVTGKYFDVTGAGTAMFRAANNASSYINANGGNFAVGHTAPTATLDVNGTGIKTTFLRTSSSATITGVADGSDAGAGMVGEIITGTDVGTHVPASGVYLAIATITVTAGDWDVSGQGRMNSGATTAATIMVIGISLNSTSLDNTTAGGLFYNSVVPPVSGAFIFPTGARRISVSGSTPVYLVCMWTFSTIGGATCGGSSNVYLRARRVR